MKKTIAIAIVGLVAGGLDLIPLILADAPRFNMLAIMAFWLVVCFFTVNTVISKNSILNGLLVAVLLMIPVVLTVAAINPKDLIPMLSMAVILGPLVGFVLGRILGKPKE